MGQQRAGLHDLAAAGRFYALSRGDFITGRDAAGLRTVL